MNFIQKSVFYTAVTSNIWLLSSSAQKTNTISYFKRYFKKLYQSGFSCHYRTSQPIYYVTLRGSVSQVRFDDLSVQKHLSFLLKSFSDAEEKLKEANDNRKNELRQFVISLEPLIALKCELEKLLQQVEELNAFILELEKQKDDELLMVAQKEKQSLIDHVHQCENAIVNALVPEQAEDRNDIVIELSAGVGGQEAMLFTKTMFDMYCGYATYKGWNWEIIRYDETDLGGLRNAHISIDGMDAYKFFKFESGVHRVQRVPKTEKSGRIHTSTMAVAVLPQPAEINVVLERKDIKMEFKRSSGAGGQHVNTTDSCVRLVHIPTGIMVECQMERCQHKNRELALKSLRAKLYQRSLQASEQELASSRKLQVGTSARSDKVRTYNFAQDRITDHRIQHNMYNIESFLEGKQQLDQLLKLLQNWYNIELLTEILKKYA